MLFLIKLVQDMRIMQGHEVGHHLGVQQTGPLMRHACICTYLFIDSLICVRKPVCAEPRYCIVRWGGRSL